METHLFNYDEFQVGKEEQQRMNLNFQATFVKV